MADERKEKQSEEPTCEAPEDYWMSHPRDVVKRQRDRHMMLLPNIASKNEAGKLKRSLDVTWHREKCRK